MTATLPSRRLGLVPSCLLRRHAHRVVLVLAGLATALVLLSLAGAARDDAAIDASTGRATAEVLSTSGSWTVVRFAAADGEVYTPEQGVAYPSGLMAGHLVRVEYAATDPDLVRVAGRSWVVGLRAGVLVIVLVWALAAPLAWWLRPRAG
ncbi:MAG TPA: DUF3592 domain-containing protein [Pseudonocardiaceae bacterium]|nr:DUF3592 domain-containing protein [Pseudonocardiaceae bacterium]